MELNTFNKAKIQVNILFQIEENILLYTDIIYAKSNLILYEIAKSESLVR